MELFDKYGWQIGSFLSVVGLMMYLVKTLLNHFFKRLEKTDDIIDNHISGAAKVMTELVLTIQGLNGRIREEHKEILNEVKKQKEV